MLSLRLQGLTGIVQQETRSVQKGFQRCGGGGGGGGGGGLFSSNDTPGLYLVRSKQAGVVTIFE